MSETNKELLEALRLLHERVARIEGLPSSYNPFAGANKSELDRIAALEAFQARTSQINDDQARALVLHDALFQDMRSKIKQIQAQLSAPAPPAWPVPPPPPPAWPVPKAPPAWPGPQAPQPDYAPSAPEGWQQPDFPAPPGPSAARRIAANTARPPNITAKNSRFIKGAERLSTSR